MVFLFFLRAEAQPPDLRVEKAEITFKIKNAGFNVTGSLGGFEGIIRFDPKNLPESKMEVYLDARSIDTGLKMRDKKLRERDYFDVSLHPRIKMRSLRFTQNGGGFVGLFELTLKGVRRDISVPFQYAPETGLFSGAFRLNRLDYNIGQKSRLMSDEVNILISVKTSH